MTDLVHTYILRASGRFEPYIDALNQSLDRAIIKTGQNISLHPIDIVIYDSPPHVISGYGFGARTHNPHIVRISLDPNFPNFDNVIAKDLPRVISHELHHAVRGKAVGYGKTLLEALISEGLACHFEHDLWGGTLYPWVTAIHGTQLLKIQQHAEKSYDAIDYNHATWFYGAGDLPRWAGYTLGYELIANYLKKHPDASAASFVAAPAKKFV